MPIASPLVRPRFVLTTKYWLRRAKDSSAPSTTCHPRSSGFKLQLQCLTALTLIDDHPSQKTTGLTSAIVGFPTLGVSIRGIPRVASTLAVHDKKDFPKKYSDTHSTTECTHLAPRISKNGDDVSEDAGIGIDKDMRGGMAAVARWTANSESRKAHSSRNSRNGSRFVA